MSDFSNDPKMRRTDLDAADPIGAYSASAEKIEDEEIEDIAEADEIGEYVEIGGVHSEQQEGKNPYNNPKNHIITAVLLVGMMIVLMLTDYLKGRTEQPVVQRAQQMDVVIHVECSGVYSVGMEYCVDRVLLGGQECMGDPSRTQPLTEGEALSFSFSEMDFWAAENFDSGIFGFAMEVASADGEYMPIGFLWEWDAQYGEKYHFTLSRSADGNYVLAPTEADAVYTQTPLDEISFE